MAVLEIEHLNFSYGNHQILEDVNFNLEKGDIAGLIGSNGAGKTTLMKIIGGILPGAQGKIKRPTGTIGALIEEPALYPNKTVQENLKFYCRLFQKDYSLIDQFKDDLGVVPYLHKKASKLSLGMKQRVGLFIALIASDELIMLDEPTNGLDPDGIDDLLNLIVRLARQHQITFIISSHILSNLDQVCTKNFMIKDHHLKSLDDDSVVKYCLRSFNCSGRQLAELLDEYGLDYHRRGNDIIVTNKEMVEAKLEETVDDLSFEKLGLREVVFTNEKA